MPTLNARCDTCGAIFPSGIVVENSTNVTFKDVRSGPCPRCGGMGTVAAEATTFDVIGDRLTVKRGRLSAGDMAIIVRALQPFQDGDRSKKAVTEAIVKVLPELESEVRGASLNTVLAILSLIISLFMMNQAQDIADAAMLAPLHLGGSCGQPESHASPSSHEGVLWQAREPC